MSDDLDDDFDDDLTDGEFDEADDDADATAAGLTFSVGEFIAAVNNVLRRGFPGGAWVQGEVSRWRIVGRNAYCDLIEHKGSKVAAKVELSFFGQRFTAVQRTLSQHRVKIEDGVKIRIQGKPEVWNEAGKFSVIVSAIDPRFTLGDMQATRDAIVKKLKDAGLYDENRSREMPEFPLRVGVVTSVGTAAWRDIISRFEASGLPFQLKVADVRVQGSDAVPGIVDALWRLGTRDDVDVIMMIRGGGAKTDLACFDAEQIAVAIAQCPVPVITGIGHEIDVSIADEVAHSSYTTPTACAAALIDQIKSMIDAAEGTWSAVERIALSSLELAESRLLQRAAAIKSNAVGALERSHTNIALAAQRVTVRPATILGSAESTLATLEARTRLLDPVNTMARGWTITRRADGSTIRSVADAKTGDTLVTTLADGTLTSTVTGDDHDG